jgi:hypothetical protein
MTLRLAVTVWLCSIALVAGQETRGTKARSAKPGPEHLSLFAHSEDCIACHNNLSTPAGEDVSIGATWRSTMMANASRDPYWQAGVRRETIDHPEHTTAIQDECGACHMPMATRVARAAGGKGEVFSHLPFGAPPDSRPHGTSSQRELGRLAADGVSCTVCHQISSEHLGTRESFNGEFVMAPAPPGGVRPIFGPFEVDPGRRTIMRSVTGFAQEEAPHIRQSEVCATCHTLITTAFGPNGEVVGSLPEQMNYQEWQHSDFSREKRSCQSCHMPAATGPLRVASVLGAARDALARHVFVGGNAHMVRLLNRYRDELGVRASPVELEATATATLRQLQRDTATLTVADVTLAAGTLSFAVDVHNLTGHKLPTGYPSRRLWLHVTVKNERGQTTFESGAFERSGSIAGNDNDADPLGFEPHYKEITSPDQVQIYESILGDLGGKVTTGLLSATQYLKDNRLLPRGFDKATAAAEIGVYGDATSDPDFGGGVDRVRYRLPVSAGGRFTIDVELRYQAIAFRWAHNLAGYNAPEPRRFVSYYQDTSSDSSVVVATASAVTSTDARQAQAPAGSCADPRCGTQTAAAPW